MGKSQGIHTSDQRDYSFSSLQRMVTPPLASVTLDKIWKCLRKSRDHVNAFKDGHTGYKASHRRV